MRTDIDRRILQEARYIAESKDTVRGCGKHFGISKSTVHKDVTQRLAAINKILYAQVRDVLEENKAQRHIRAGSRRATNISGKRPQMARRRRLELYLAAAAVLVFAVIRLFVYKPIIKCVRQEAELKQYKGVIRIWDIATTTVKGSKYTVFWKRSAAIFRLIIRLLGSSCIKSRRPAQTTTFLKAWRLPARISSARISMVSMRRLSVRLAVRRITSAH